MVPLPPPPLGRRAFAGLVDFLLIVILGHVPAYTPPGFDLSARLARWTHVPHAYAIPLLAFLFVIAMAPIYQLAFALWPGASVGKLIFGLRVYGADGTPAKLGLRLARALAVAVGGVATLNSTALIPILRPDQRRLEDLLLGAQVAGRRPAVGTPSSGFDRGVFAVAFALLSFIAWFATQMAMRPILAPEKIRADLVEWSRRNRERERSRYEAMSPQERLWWSAAPRELRPVQDRAKPWMTGFRPLATLPRTELNVEDKARLTELDLALKNKLATNPQKDVVVPTDFALCVLAHETNVPPPLKRLADREQYRTLMAPLIEHHCLCRVDAAKAKTTRDADGLACDLSPTPTVQWWEATLERAGD